MLLLLSKTASPGSTPKSTGQEAGVTPLSKPASPGSTPKSTGQEAGVTPLSKPAKSTSSGNIEFQRKIAFSAILTRLQFSKIDIPVVSTSRNQNAQPIFSDFHPSDPFALLERPPETLVHYAEKMFQQRRNGRSIKGVKIIPHGSFRRDDVTVLRKYCQISELRSMISQEEDWLDRQNDGISCAEIVAVKNLLWNSNTTKTVLKAGHKSMDVSSFATLVGERYLDNFTIDTIITRYNQECAIGSTLYLPSEVHTWMETNDDQFVIEKLQLTSRTQLKQRARTNHNAP